MTTPPPPPPGQAAWPPSQPSMTASAGTPGPQGWWTGGRIAIAVVLVLLLMGGAGFVGFLAGVAVGGSTSFLADADGVWDDGQLEYDGEVFADDVPGTVGLDVDSTPGGAVRRGGTTEGYYDGVPVDHPFTMASSGAIVIELRSDEIDTVLVLLDDQGGLIASDDDGGDSTNSMLDLDLEPGDYTVRVQGWSDFDSGGYTLVVD